MSLDGNPVRFSKEVVVGTKKLLTFNVVMHITLSKLSSMCFAQAE